MTLDDAVAKLTDQDGFMRQPDQERDEHERYLSRESVDLPDYGGHVSATVDEYGFVELHCQGDCPMDCGLFADWTDREDDDDEGEDE